MTIHRPAGLGVGGFARRAPASVEGAGTDASSDAPSGRRSERQVTVLVNAGIAQDGRDGLCRIRNVSDGGLAIETSLRLGVDAPVTVTLHSGRQLACMVRWRDEMRTGLSCDESPADALREAREQVEAQAPVLAQPHFARSCDVDLVIHGRSHPCRLDGLSVSDALIAQAPPIDPGQPVTLRVAGLGDLPAVARMVLDTHLLVVFPRPVAFRLLDPWLAGSA